ncbi:hypothetical protein SASPL_121208 [Salvia splendens]|uniref:Uncharacterized protein n=1 Tax=Salvia splendens TaxID=180675 RepID=A0A8X8XVN5_SALSN|nr:hypothetical protein SASPL_121208 [Salvia splendens]
MDNSIVQEAAADEENGGEEEPVGSNSAMASTLRSTTRRSFSLLSRLVNASSVTFIAKIGLASFDFPTKILCTSSTVEWGNKSNLISFLLEEVVEPLLQQILSSEHESHLTMYPKNKGGMTCLAGLKSHFKSQYLSEKLRIVVLPTLALVKNAKVEDYVVGFYELGGRGDFSTEELEERIAKAEVIIFEGESSGKLSKLKATTRNVRHGATSYASDPE